MRVRAHANNHNNDELHDVCSIFETATTITNTPTNTTPIFPIIFTHFTSDKTRNAQ